MRERLLRAALAAMMAGSLAACADNTREGGGGGDAKTEQAAADDRAQRQGNDMGDQLRANVSNDLSTEGRDFAEAYARLPWVHANLAAGDWERALDDLQFVNKQLDDLNSDKDVSPALKMKIRTMKPHVVALTQQIQQHDKGSIRSAALLVNQFAMLTNDPAILAWMGDRTKGGGAGR